MSDLGLVRPKISHSGEEKLDNIVKKKIELLQHIWYLYGFVLVGSVY